jgi:hypothetical protein
MRHALSCLAGQTLVLEHERQLGDFPLRRLVDLAALISDLRAVSPPPQLRWRGTSRPPIAMHPATASAIPAPRIALRPGLAAAMPVTTSGRHHQTILSAEHEHAHPREPIDPSRLPDRVVANVPARLTGAQHH